MNEQTPKVPLIFISYSHDTSDHKQWVAELASELVRKGIDVILDQWNLGLGDDVAKFMQNGVVNSDKVLMICTENYVTKVDDGTGGAGYEALIVTGELIQNLGTSKFIPILRQNSDAPQLPKSLATRFYVNMSDDAQFEENIETIVRELHQAPKIVKPALGKNPFGVTPSGDDVPAETASTKSADLTDDGNEYPDPELYQKVREIISQGDIAAWRRLTRKVYVDSSVALNNYRKTIEGNSPSTKEGILEMVQNASSALSPLISMGITGVESGKKVFRNQRALLDMITSPPAWNGSGQSRIVALPESIAFVYQAIHGATCVFTNQLDLSVDFVTQQSEYRNIEKSTHLWKNHLIMGWPTSLDTNCTLSLELIDIISRKWSWLEKLFGDVEEFQSSFQAYYLMLNLLDYIDLIRQGKADILPSDTIRLDIPLNFLVRKEETSKRAYQYLIENKEALIALVTSSAIPTEKLSRHWDDWISSCKSMYETWDRYAYRYDFPHRNLFKDLFPSIG